jgi:hypothetical protein
MNRFASTVLRRVANGFNLVALLFAPLLSQDPFEVSYDVAHVLRGGYYHRIRREFTVAYSKVADAASGRPGTWNKGDLRKMSGQELIDWICEPVEKDRDPPI